MVKGKNRREVTLQQARELGQFRATIARAMRELRSRLKAFTMAKKPGTDAQRRAAMSELVRLANAHVKVVHLEQDLLQAAEQSGVQADAPMSEADWKLLQDAMARQQQVGALPTSADRSGIDGSQQVE